jgi:sugar phosphate permease
MNDLTAAVEADAPTKSVLSRWWVVAVPLLILIMIAQIDKVAISVVMSNKQFLQDLYLIGRPAVIGMLMSGFLLTYAVSQFFWGGFVKRFGPRACAIVGILIWGLTMALSGMAQSAGSLIFARVLLGIGEGFTYAVSNAFVANWFPVRERGRASAFWFNGMALGPVVSGPLVVGIIAAGGWRTVFFTLAGLSVLIPLPMLIFLMKNRPSEHRWIGSDEVKFIEEGSWAKTKEIPKVKGKEENYLSNYRFWLVTLAWGCTNIFFWGWAAWMPTYFQTVRHFSFKSAGYIYSLNFLVVLVATLFVGWLSDRAMKRAVFATVCWLISGVLFFLGGITVENAYWAALVLIIGGLFNAPPTMLVQPLLHSVVPEHRISNAVGFGGGVSQLMGACAPVLIGFIVGAWGFGAVIVCLSLATFIPGILTFFLQKEGY